MKARSRWLLLACGACAVTSVAAGAPAVLRRMDAFQVQRVEIRGTRYLAAYDALRQTGITRTSNIFDAFAPWRARLLRHPMVLDAQIERELPNTIKVAITEAEPLALVRTPELQPVDARSRVLPVSPAMIDMDLPVLVRPARPDSTGYFRDASTRSAIAVLGTLRSRDARLFSWVSEAAPAGPQGILLRLRQPRGAEALLAADPRALRLRELEVALSDLSARGELSQLKRIDARFRDQIVVSLDQDNRN
jgi:hypothetical protein